MRSRFVIRLDDIAPGMRWDAAARVESLLRGCAIRPLIGVVPDNRDPDLERGARRDDFWSVVRGWAAAGWTVAQHGYQHVCRTRQGGLLSIQPRSEFAGLPFDTQRGLLRRGRDILEREGLATDIFMAPWHSYDRGTLLALRALGFTTLTDGFGLYSRRSEGLLHVPQLFSTPVHFGVGVYTVCLHVNSMSEEELAGLERFCRERRGDIVAFPDAAAATGPAALNVVSRWLLAGGLRAYRALNAPPRRAEAPPAAAR